MFRSTYPATHKIESEDVTRGDFTGIGYFVNLQIGVKLQNEKITLRIKLLKSGITNRPAKEVVLQTRRRNHDLASGRLITDSARLVV